jgi:hypothetical protein
MCEENGWGKSGRDILSEYKTNNSSISDQQSDLQPLQVAQESGSQPFCPSNSQGAEKLIL